MDEGNSREGREGTSEDIESLLSLPVNKDYINCVWTHEPLGKSRCIDMDSSPEKLVIANLSASSDQEQEENSVSNQESPQIDGSDDEVSLASVLKKKKKKKLEKIVDQENSKARMQTSETFQTSVDKTENVSEIPKSIFGRKRKKKTKEKPDTNSPKKTPLKAKDKQKVNVEVGKPDRSKPTTNVKSGRRLNTVSELDTDKDLCVAYKNLLVQQPLPPYSPRDLDTRYFSGHFFRCKACEDKFVLQSSLIAHMSRKTARFSFKCPVCKSRVRFDNRCGLILHIKSHKMNVHSINQDDLKILPLAMEEDECNSLFKHISCYTLRCPECSKVVASMGSHLQGFDANPDESLPGLKFSLECKECSYVLPTSCAFAAHQRYHRGDAPFTCPECGDIFLTSSSLLSHMEENCFHNQKRTLYQCVYCKVFVISIELFTEHLTAKHLRPVYKCHVCGVSVGAFEELNDHRATQHKLPGVEPLSGTAALSAHVECDKCPGVVLNLDSLQEHATSHTSDPQLLATVYMCKDCNSMFTCKNTLLTHKALCQGKTKSTSDTEVTLYELSGDVFSCFQPAASSQVVSSKQASQAPKGCAPSGATQLVSGKFPVGNKILNSNSEGKDVSSSDELKYSQDEAPDSMIESGDINAQLTSSPDSGKSFKKCRLCKEVVSVGNDKAALKKHFTSKHFSIFMKAVYDKGSAQFSTQGVSAISQEPLNDRRNLAEFLKSLRIDYRNSNGFPKGDSKVVVGKKKKKASKFSNKSPGKLLSPKLYQAMSGFSCYKCSFTSNNTETFRSHIILHKSNQSDLQCPQCGLCFIVRPPLEKHLIVEHGIRNVENYLVSHGFEDDDSSEEGESKAVDVEEAEPEELQENQCKVCRKIFESAILLEKHFRVHGGAFLLANMKAKKSGVS